ncbi:MAG: hypothetical protein DWQ42_05905 [Planctomycetota bacterium]|nr:MAG: hypothetical protein DWQ42_05905 [Planctomycetota bacterium]REK42257.1 MAG: hypothetical protein DWQ46_14060 [Planctomycetota bacterium]
MSRLLTSLLFFATLWLAAHAQAEEAEFRTWTSAGGKFTIEARLLRLGANDKGQEVAILLRRDGRIIEVTLSALSQADQDYAAATTQPEEPSPPTAAEPDDGQDSDERPPADDPPREGTEEPSGKGGESGLPDLGIPEPGPLPPDSDEGGTKPAEDQGNAGQSGATAPLPEGDLPPATPTLSEGPSHAVTLLPTDSKSWINLSERLTPKSVGRKGIVVVHVRPTTSERNAVSKWQGWRRAASNNKDAPVIFVLLFSNRTPQRVKVYLRLMATNRLSVDWPALLDPSGRIAADLAAASDSAPAGGDERRRSSGNITVIDGHGRVLSDRFTSASSAAGAASRTAQWRVDPKGIPEDLRSAWLDVEFGRFDDAVGGIRKGLKSKQAATARAAKRLHDFIQGQIAEAAGNAHTALTAGNKAHAYRAYNLMMSEFGDYDIKKEHLDVYARLQADPQLADEIAAFNLLDAALRKAGNKSYLPALKKTIEKFPDTTAAKDAEILMERTFE